MKTILKLFALILLFSVGFETQVNAQEKTLTASTSWVANGSAPLVSTTALAATATYRAFMNPFFQAVKYQLKTTTNTGSTLCKAVMYFSFDYVNWTKIDSVTCTGAGASSFSTVNTTVYTPYIKWILTAHTNAQSTNWQLYITGLKP